MRIENGLLIIDLTGSLVPSIIFIVWMALGWSRGFRWIVTIAGAITLGYLLTVQNGGIIVNLVNGIYDFFLRFINFISPSIAALFPPPPVITANAQAPLLLRILIFFVLLIIGISYTGPWEGKPLSGWNGYRPMRLLGLATGFYIALLMISAIASFWNEGRDFVTFPSLLTLILNSFQTYQSVISVFLVAFIGLLILIFLLRFNRIFLPDGAKK